MTTNDDADDVAVGAVASDSLCRYDEALSHSLVQHVCKSVGRDLLVRFVVCFLLESNLTSVRWQAHSLVLHIYRSVRHSHHALPAFNYVIATTIYNRDFVYFHTFHSVISTVCH